MISAAAAPISPAVQFSPRPEKEDKAAEDKHAVSPQKNIQNPLSDEEKAQVEKLKKRDQEVRAHEQAHKNAGGQYAGSASYSYQVGPDGKRYAVGGEVSIDIAPIEGDPDATISKMNVIISAALAPAKPSSQDRRVAAQAAAQRNKAQAEPDKNSETDNKPETNNKIETNNKTEANNNISPSLSRQEKDTSFPGFDPRVQAAQNAYNIFSGPEQGREKNSGIINLIS